AGVAHEINTPVGAILNVSRNLARMLAALPRSLVPFWHGAISPTAMEGCLDELRQANTKTGDVSSYRETKQVERFLEQQRVEDAKARAEVLARIRFTDPELLSRHLDCVRNSSFLKLADAYGSMAQGVAIAETSSQKIAEIVRALKYYARSDTDRVAPIEINESIHTALVLLRNHLKNRVRVETDLATGLPPVIGTGELNQIWTNLLTNACDAIEERGPDHEGMIRVGTSRAGDRILVRVTDNGVGIPEDKLQKVFDPFYTTKDIGKGTGLGLSIVSGIVTKLGGAVSVVSRPGETTFEISLRLAENMSVSAIVGTRLALAPGRHGSGGEGARKQGPEPPERAA
ncbi:MAG TPA: ATP-binding protein, partial [Candidatus Angelobacter sp.]|nr:ATP-binding protein [Candidatus Angelobacter sp.]